MHQTFEKSSLAMTHKFDDMIELPESQPKETHKEDLECEMVMVRMPRCMSFLGSTDACDKHIGSLGMMNNEVGNTSPQSTPQILPSFEEYTLPLTYPEEVEETLGTPMEVEPLDHTKLKDIDDPKKHYGFKPGLLRSLTKSFSNSEVIFDKEGPEVLRIFTWMILG
ncbi:hypothetical protein Tco_1436783 [Tanacetum coccineum]